MVNKHIDFVVRFMQWFNGKSVLITGGAGFIGFHLCKALSNFSSNLTIYDNLSSGKFENVTGIQNAHFVKADILDQKTLFSTPKADLIYHLAAQVVVPYSMDNPVDDFETNTRGTLYVLEKARKDDAKLVFASSAAVYGNPSKLPTPEEYGHHPFSFYGLSKAVAEDYCNMYHEKYGLDVTILRFANVYGSRCHGVINDFLDKIKRNPYKLEIIGTGEQSRDFIHVSDVVDALLLSAVKEKAKGQTYNVGFGKTTRIVDLAKMILQIMGLTEKTVITITGSSWSGDIDIIWFDISKAKQELKWTPKIRVEDHLRMLIIERGLLNG
jgi:UDP-glucose 4-epimerase